MGSLYYFIDEAMLLLKKIQCWISLRAGMVNDVWQNIIETNG